MSLLFLGVGNLHRADDGVGPLIAQNLEKNADLLARGVKIMAHSGEGASLMHLWEGMDLAVVVDAMKSGQELGSIHRFDASEERLHYGVFRYSSHLFGLAEATEMARALGTLPKKLLIYGIEGVEFGFGEPMSVPVMQAVKVVEEMVIQTFDQQVA